MPADVRPAQCLIRHIASTTGTTPAATHTGREVELMAQRGPLMWDAHQPIDVTMPVVLTVAMGNVHAVVLSSVFMTVSVPAEIVTLFRIE